MSLKSLIQIIILLTIIIILGSVYFNYFANYNKLSLQEKQGKITTEINNTLPKKENEANNKIDKKELKKKITEKKNLNIKTKDESQKSTKKAKLKETQIDNLVSDVEYLTTDEKGNKYKLLARSGRSNKNDNNILDLDDVRGFITSTKRSTIYIVSDFAEYNTSNLNSKFYQNVVINYEDKQITCENFDIDMQTNIATAYNNVVVTDPKSIMRAGIMTLDIETKNININPSNKKNKVTVTTN